MLSQGGARPETLAMVERWRKEQEEFWAKPEDQPDDFLDRWLPQAAPMLDAGWNGYGLPPSDVLSARYCMMMAGSWDQREYAARWVEWVKAEAHARVAKGFHPYPLTSPRSAVSTTGTLPA